MLISEHAAIVITTTVLALATIVLILRCDVRYRLVKNHGIEDILVICAWVCIKTPFTIFDADCFIGFCHSRTIALLLGYRTP